VRCGFLGPRHVHPRRPCPRFRRPVRAAGVRPRRARGAREPAHGVDPWFHRYHGDLANDAGLRTWARAKRQLLDLAGGVAGKVVVDVGSGFGMVSNLLATGAPSASWHSRCTRA
jgi:hypothetical protein